MKPEEVKIDLELRVLNGLHGSMIKYKTRSLFSQKDARARG